MGQTTDCDMVDCIQQDFMAKLCSFATDHLGFKRFGGKPIKVIGWSELQTEAKQLQWIESFSDHAMLFGQIET